MALGAGTRLGPYEIAAAIGAGGMGEVYRARDTRLQRAVAIKVLPERLCHDPDWKLRFEREARAISSLQHPHICVLHDVGHHAGIDYLVLEYLEGETLAQRLERGPLPLPQAWNIGMEMAGALEQAHRQGVVHRDLKPGNILLTPSGSKLMDFGLAKVTSELSGPAHSRLDTLTGQILGTALYMSPEQASGQSVDHRTDIFSLGIVLWEMLTGRHPWQRAAMIDTIHAIVHDPLPALALSGAAGTEVERVLRKALEKNPLGRYRSASELLSEMSVAEEKLSSKMAATTEEASIAVPPFVFLSPVEDKESLSLGFADALITTLGRLESLRVPPTAAILKYPSGSDPLLIGSELCVRYVLQGNIQKIGSRWRVSLQLFDTEQRKTVLSEGYDFNLSNIFEIQDEIGKNLAHSLQQHFHAGMARARERYSSDPEAYSEYLRGLDGTYRETIQSSDQAIGHFSAAIERDPNFALAHAMLSHACATRYFGYEARHKWLQKAETHCARALQLAPGLPEAIMADAYLLWTPHKNFQHLETIAQLKKAVAMQPNLDHAYNRMGTVYAHIGRLEEAEEAYQKARHINPQNTGHHNIALAYLWSGQYSRARNEVEAFYHKQPGNKYSLWYRPQPPLLLGDFQEASKLVGEALQSFPEEPLFISLRGLLHAHLKESELALEAATRASASPLSFGHTHHTYYQLACIYAVLGNIEVAMEWLERTVDTGFPCWPFFLQDFSLSNLHGLPEFEDLVASLRAEFAPPAVHD